MQNTGLPAKFGIPFGNGAAGNYIRPIPQASQIGIQAGAASLTDGFPPVTFLPVAAGGTPPFGQDFNGLLNQITAWVRLLQAGMPVPFDAAFQASIGGYPFKARVLDTTTNIVWESLVNNNTASIGTTNWSVPIFVDPNTAGLIVYGVTNSNGANIRLQGNGAAGTKTIRAANGNFQIYNNAYTQALFDMTDAGIATINGVRAAVGAFGSGDPNRVPNLSDFTYTTSGHGTNFDMVRWPNGVMQQGMAVAAPAGLGLMSTAFTLPYAYTSYLSTAIISFQGTAPPAPNNQGSISVTPNSLGSVVVTTNYGGGAGNLGCIVWTRGV